MKRIALLGATLALGLLSVFPARAQSAKSDAITAGCGTVTYTGGRSQNDTMDTSGNQCVSATISGTVTISGAVTTSPTASTPAAGTASAIVTGGSPTTLITGPVNGCIVTNPLSASDQNIATAEVAQINPVTTATANGRGTNFTLQPGDSFVCPPGMTTNISAIAATTAHAFSVVKW